MSDVIRNIKTKIKNKHPIFAGVLRELLWFPPFMDASKIGYGYSPYTLFRLLRQKKIKKELNICILTAGIPKRLRKNFIDLQVFWINERSKVCHLYVDGPIEKADAIWIYTQDPIEPERMERLKAKLAKADPEIPIINPPESYNFYHQIDAFPKLEKAGVNVPRTTFTENDIGKTKIVYKKFGVQSSEKFTEFYRGPVEGYRAFEFIDYEDNGLFSRYRAFYLFGAVLAGKVCRSPGWNSCMKNQVEVDVTFEMPPLEVGQLKLIGKTAGLDYFAVDYLRQKPDNKPVFVDINVFPTIAAKPATTFHQGYSGYWHTFDSRGRMGIPEPAGIPVWQLFDEALLNWVKSKHEGKKDLQHAVCEA